MKRSAILNHLALARRYVAEGHDHIARQRALIAKLEARGEDTAQARRVLGTLEAMQATHVVDCQQLTKAWQRNSEPFSPEDADIRIESAHAVGHASIEELRWYQAQMAETADVLRRSREAIDGSQQILSKFEHVGPPKVTL